MLNTEQVSTDLHAQTSTETSQCFLCFYKLGKEEKHYRSEFSDKGTVAEKVCESDSPETSHHVPPCSSMLSAVPGCHFCHSPMG